MSYRIFSSEDDMEFIENGIDMLSFLTYYQDHVSEGMWTIFGPMIAALDGWAYDYMMEMLTPILNFISKDVPGFLRGSYNGVSYLQMILTIAQKFIESERYFFRCWSMSNALLGKVMSVRPRLPAHC